MSNFVPLTRKQALDYFLHMQEQTGNRSVTVGMVADDDHCPLAEAYRFTHPKAEGVEFGLFCVRVNGVEYDYRNWQYRFIQEVDKLVDLQTEVTADYAIGLLETV